MEQEKQTEVNEVNQKQVLANVYNLIIDLNVRGDDVDKVFYIKQILINALKNEEVK